MLLLCLRKNVLNHNYPKCLMENVHSHSHHFNYLTHQITYANSDNKLLAKAVFLKCSLS